MDPEVLEMVMYLSEGRLPECERKAKKTVLQASQFTLVEGVLYYLDPNRGDRKRCVVPRQLRSKIMEEWSHECAFIWGAIVQDVDSPLVVAEHVLQCCVSLRVLSAVCDCEFLRSSEQATTLPYTSATNVPDSWSGRDGFTKNRSG